jgi:hypothetical protein
MSSLFIVLFRGNIPLSTPGKNKRAGKNPLLVKARTIRQSLTLCLTERSRQVRISNCRAASINDREKEKPWKKAIKKGVFR